MESRQVISTELARATIGVLISSPRARVPAPPRPWARWQFPNYVSYISAISFHTYLSEDLAMIHGHGPLLRL
ncbi:CHY-type/CTCHY-type/RING-type zinc finger protein [Actinidia rufa]|uniref:CHY-type/CTCHY-type/RING-type zinc finger protein n=1 Tax=Actinidia rufa TaxID=165716 RepID=A0A7J0F089_9ERIC|nr:CHY-type/CTCHY-type/RING-type zinc finger protein [Actinidia rufa]